ncbi:MAG: hypothetical protein HKN07_16465 [Acidimicrobiia bacterium]|nr:hypothetical protein [Acidimicrobiia bacterium]
MEEQVERVPWSVLQSRERIARWWWYLGGTVLLAAALTAGLVYVVGSDDPVTMFDDVSTVTMLAGANNSESPATTTELLESAVAVATPPTASIYSEADLLAVVDNGSEPLVAATAEVFVQRYFARNDASHVSHVEWARAIRIEPRGDGGFSVEVAFSTVAGPIEGPFVRMPPRAVLVEVAVGEGSAQVLGLPKMLDRVPIEAPRPAEEVVAAAEALPTEAILAAQTAAAPWGAVEIVGGWHADTWTVMVAVTDEMGARWEFAVDTGVS